MILYDYECERCGSIREVMASMDESHIDCVRCKGPMKRIISVSGAYCSNEDTDWIKSITEVVEKDSGKPHCEEFLKNPTRSNYKTWMQKEGLRHLEPGEERRKRPDRNEAAILHEVMKRHQKRRAISVRS